MTEIKFSANHCSHIGWTWLFMADSCGFSHVILSFVIRCKSDIKSIKSQVWESLWHDVGTLYGVVTGYICVSIENLLSYMLVCYLLVNITFISLKLTFMPKLPYLISFGQFELLLKHLYLVALYYLEHFLILIAISRKLLHCIVYCAFIAWFEGELCLSCALVAW